MLAYCPSQVELRLDFTYSYLKKNTFNILNILCVELSIYLCTLTYIDI